MTPDPQTLPKLAGEPGDPGVRGPSLRSHDELKALAEAGAAELGWDAPARDVIAWVVRN
ncbi:MAG: phosphoadenylyl-sulfate reductase, partial [Gemmatimonadales bacterium]